MEAGWGSCLRAWELFFPPRREPVFLNRVYAKHLPGPGYCFRAKSGHGILNIPRPHPVHIPTSNAIIVKCDGQCVKSRCMIIIMGIKFLTHGHRYH